MFRWNHDYTIKFFSSIRKADIDLRRSFLERFTIDVLNIFEEQVFDDTSYAVCTIQFIVLQKILKKLRILTPTFILWKSLLVRINRRE